MQEHIEKITQRLSDKAVLKQEVYQDVLKWFNQMKVVLEKTVEGLSERMKDHPEVALTYKEKNAFEAEIKFGGDVLIFSMHTNVFSFQEGFFVHDLDYVKQDPDRAYCGMIEIYNFLADSFKYSRIRDTGYLAARIFINREGRFFVEGQDQLGFLYKEFGQLVMNEDVICHIIEQSILFAIGFDLWAPPYQEVKEISVGQKMQQSIAYNHKTGKRVGFDFLGDDPTR